MMSDIVDKETVEAMYLKLRKAEYKNDRTGELDDKKMVDAITNYFVKAAKEEAENN